MRPVFAILSLSLLAGAACQRTDRSTATPGSVRIGPAAPSTPEAPLRETRWVLRRLASQPVADTAGGHQPFLLITQAGTAEGQGSCNTFRGTIQPAVNDGELQFSPLASTRMACPTLGTETLFTKALQSTRAYRIQGDTLWLYGTPERTGTALARLVAAPVR